MRQLNNLFTQNFFQISYKLLHDLLFAILLLLALTLLAEELLPGIVSEHVGISKIVVMLVLNIFLINFIHPQVENKLAKDIPSASKKTIFTVSLFGILLLINSFLKIGFLLNFLLVIQVAIISYLIYAILLKK